MKLICVLFLLCVLVYLASAEKPNFHGELIYASVIYRHGDRTPVGTYPTDPYANRSFWNDNFGELTNLGKQEHYNLGQYLKWRYNSILKQDYDETQIAIVSTTYDRTLESAQSNLAGMYPPTGKSVWNPNLAWQPIPVRSIPAEYDNQMGEPLPPCEAYENASAALTQTKKYKDLIAESQPLFQNLTKYTGENITTLDDALLIRDNLLVNSIHHTIPMWAQAVFPGGQLEKLTRFGYNMAAATPTLARLRSGYLFKNILDSSTNKTAGTLVSNYSVNVYSAHDSTVANMLNLLGLYNENSPPPPYAATVLIEIRSVANKSFVEVFYKNSSAPPMPQYIPKCGWSCELPKMYTLYKDYIPTADFQTECKVKKSLFSKIKSWF